MVRINKRMIEITAIKIYGRNHELYCNKVLGLRTARNAGDKEIVNNTVLGKLRRENIGFTIITD